MSGTWAECSNRTYKGCHVVVCCAVTDCYFCYFSLSVYSIAKCRWSWWHEIIIGIGIVAKFLGVEIKTKWKWWPSEFLRSTQRSYIEFSGRRWGIENSRQPRHLSQKFLGNLGFPHRYFTGSICWVPHNVTFDYVHFWIQAQSTSPLQNEIPWLACLTVCMVWSNYCESDTHIATTKFENWRNKISHT